MIESSFSVQTRAQPHSRSAELTTRSHTYRTTPLSEQATRSPSYEVEGDEDTSFFPSQRLLSAILLRAVRDFVTYRHASRESEQYLIAVDAAGWVFWDGEEETFRYICDQIDVDPEKMRRIMLALTPDDLLRMTPPERTEE